LISPRISGPQCGGQVKEEALSRLNKLEEMKERVEARKLVIERIKGQSKVAAENSTKEEERLSSEVRSLLVAGTALSLASKQLQVIEIYI